MLIWLNGLPVLNTRNINSAYWAEVKGVSQINNGNPAKWLIVNFIHPVCDEKTAVFRDPADCKFILDQLKELASYQNLERYASTD
jgi:hypothetical protein